MKYFQNAIAAAVLVAAVGCVGSDTFREAREQEALGHWDVAVIKYAKAVEINPDSSGYKAALARARLKASQFHFEKGKMYRASGRPDIAVIELEQTVLLDPTNDFASVELRKAKEEQSVQDVERNSESKMEKLKKKTRGARAVAPMLEPASDKPINLNFPQPKPIKQIYRALADAAGINIIFDPQLKDDNVSIVLTSIDFQRALETLMRQENHFYKVIDERTVLIAADTPANRKTYEDLVIRTFFLSNGDVTEVANALRALLQTTRISVNKSENSITLRDTADKVSVAERIVEQNDKQLSEVVVDVEVLQINTKKLESLGLILSPRSVSAQIPSPGGTTNIGAPLPSGSFSWDQLKQLSIKSFGFTLPSATLTFIKDNSEAELLAKPQLRISEGQKAQLLIGDKVPIPTTTFNTSQTVGGNIVPITSFQYQDVGIKIEVEPRVHHNREVTLKLQLEVSQLGEPVQLSNGQSQPVIGTRSLAANIRLKDGETNFLAGLFRTDKTRSKSTIPFLGDIPILGRLFTQRDLNDATTDVVMTITPHIIRIPDVTEEDVTPVYVGTDANIAYQGTPRVESPNRDAGPFDANAPGKGAQPPARSPQPAGAPPGINLAPSGGPSDIFKPSTPPTTVPATPRQAVPSQGANLESKSEEVGPATSILMDFDPAYLALAPGQQQTLMVRATSVAGLPGGTLSIRFDPSIAAAVAARAILGGGAGVADARIEGDHVILDMPGSEDLAGTRAVAEITLRGIAAGRTTLTFEPAALGDSAVVFSQTVVEVR